MANERPAKCNVLGDWLEPTAIRHKASLPTPATHQSPHSHRARSLLSEEGAGEQGGEEGGVRGGCGREEAVEDRTSAGGSPTPT